MEGSPSKRMLMKGIPIEMVFWVEPNNTGTRMEGGSFIKEVKRKDTPKKVQ